MPFTPAQFFEVFRSYNEFVWPAPLLLSLLAVVAATVAFTGRQLAVKLTLLLLFVWCAVMYHWLHFTPVNPAAWLFGALFVAGGFLFLRDVHFGEAAGARVVAGLLFIGYALVAYPLIAFALGHRYPWLPTFGAPCPLTIYAIGLLLTARAPLPVAPAIVPLIWAAIGSSAAVSLGVREDLGLTAAGLTLLAVLIQDRLPSTRGEKLLSQT